MTHPALLQKAVRTNQYFLLIHLILLHPCGFIFGGWTTHKTLVGLKNVAILYTASPLLRCLRFSERKSLGSKKIPIGVYSVLGGVGCLLNCAFPFV